MKRIRYSVAMSLDGYIAGANGEYDWIIMDPDIDFGEIFGQFDTILMGRRTFEPMQNSSDTTGLGMFADMKTFVFSRTLQQSDFPDVTIVSDDLSETARSLKEGSGKDIWLFGGGLLFRSLAAAGLVDAVEVAVFPVLLGGGIPLFPPPATQIKLKLTSQKTYEKTGIVGLEYAVIDER